ncbi:hypothetical protein [Rhodopirellula baltica]|nr:hypothetical protein [Rhodopirellula baltica]
MQSRFVQISPIADSEVAPKESVVEGITSPAFYLLTSAKETNRLSELRRRVHEVPDSSQSDQIRAKLALLFMIDVASLTSKSPATPSQSTSAILDALATLVRKQSPDSNRQDWPEILALAYGRQSALRRSELVELAASICSPKMEDFEWDSNGVWDVYAFGSLAALTLSNETNAMHRSVSSSAFENSPFRSWQRASVVSANSRGNGFAAATWRPMGYAVHKVSGHNNDYLYLPSPLTGDFEIECDLTGQPFQEMQVAYADFLLRIIPLETKPRSAGSAVKKCCHWIPR